MKDKYLEIFIFFHNNNVWSRYLLRTLWTTFYLTSWHTLNYKMLRLSIGVLIIFLLYIYCWWLFRRCSPPRLIKLEVCCLPFPWQSFAPIPCHQSFEKWFCTRLHHNNQNIRVGFLTNFVYRASQIW